MMPRMARTGRARLLLVLLATGLSGCSHFHRKAAPLERSRFFTALPADDPLQGNMVPVHDPSIIRRNDGIYVVFDTDIPFLRSEHFLEQRCSTDLLHWSGCGYVFDTMPAWVHAMFPQATGLWAPDISWFHGRYHLYYSVSTLGSQHSAIALATNVTLDPHDPRYHWADQGIVLASEPGDPYNAIDASVWVDLPNGPGEPRVWLNFGSFWDGIFQQELAPATGRLIAKAPRVHLAQQPASRGGALEGSTMAAHNGWYYLFASVGVCCAIPIERDTYQQIVGRSHSVHGPFLAEDGGELLRGGGTVLLTGDSNWIGPGGGSLWQDAGAGETLLAFHALHRKQNGALDLWVERVRWQNDWPVLVPLR